MARILIADDDRDIRKLLQINLEMEGYEVCLASTAEEALHMAALYHPDLLILDAMVPPGCNGALHQEIRNKAGIACGSAIVVSGYPRDYYETNYGTLDGAYFVKKPFDPQELVTMVESVLEKTEVLA